jgi:hypothetical protein
LNKKEAALTFQLGMQKPLPRKVSVAKEEEKGLIYFALPFQLSANFN